MERKRDRANYPVKTFSFENVLNDEVITLAGCPTRIVKAGDVENLLVEVYQSMADFEAINASLPKWNREFTITPQVREQYAGLFTLMENSALEFLGESSDEFQIQTLIIDLNTLNVRATAQGKQRINKFVSDAALTLEEFVQLKTQYSDLVESFEQFAWEFAKSQDENLAKFN